MKTWLRDDGVWVSEKPSKYVICYDAIGNPVYYDDMIVLFNKYRMTCRVLYGGNIVQWTYTYKHREKSEEVYPYDVFQDFVKNGYIKPINDGSQLHDEIQFTLPRINTTDSGIKKEKVTKRKVFCITEDNKLAWCYNGCTEDVYRVGEFYDYIDEKLDKTFKRYATGFDI